MMSYSPMQLAEAFLTTGELEDALDALNQQLEQHANDDTARRLRIQVLMRLNSEQNLLYALADFEKLPFLTAEDYQTASIIYEGLGKLDDAITVMKQALKQSANNERMTERLLELLLTNEAHDDALALIRQQERRWRWLEREGDTLVLMGDDTMATARYGLVLAQLEQFAGQMQEDYLNALKARVLLARAHAYRRLEQIETASEHYQAAKALLPDDPTIDFNLGLLTFLQGDLESAIEQCRVALESASSHLADSMRESIQNDDIYQVLAKSLSKSN
jgi:tetratricopeptide (TPR) repeat protein